MIARARTLAGAGLLLTAAIVGGPAVAQKQGGVLRLSHFDSPASMSILEESARAALQPMMGVFNNLVMYDQNVARNSMQSIVPDLATSWSWSEDGTELIFPLRRGVKWHDGTSRPPEPRIRRAFEQRPLHPKDRALQEGFSMAAGGDSDRELD